MSNPIHRVPDQQKQAFGRALCKRLGIDPADVGDGWEVNVYGDLAEVRLITYLPAQDVTDMFNAAGEA